MEMVEGTVLRNLITPEGMEYQRAVEIICQICEAVQAAHEKKIIHRDLKPDNVIVKRSGAQDRVKVLDFGIAKLREADQTESSAPQTKVGTIMGTPQYMSPEQCRGIRSEDLKPASDVYSIGIIAYELLCGRVPFDGQNALELIDKHKHEPPTHIKTYTPRVPASVSLVVMKTLAKMPEDRWESAERLAQELRIALREARGGKTVPGDPVITEVLTGPLWTDQLSSPGQPAADFESNEAKPRETVPIEKITSRPTPTPAPVPTPAPAQVSQPNWVKRGLISAAVMLLASVVIYWLANSTQTPLPPNEFAGMNLILGGKFTMGRNDGEDDERPVRELTVNDYYLDKYEVTNEQYKKFVDATGHRPPLNWNNNSYQPGEALLPVTNVTWRDADAYAKWAKKRLPTEAEWEYAARGGNKGLLYPWGNDWNPDNANVGRRSLRPFTGGSFRNDVSPFGIYDLGGNVSEWVQDNHLVYGTTTPFITECPECKVYRGSNYYVVTKVEAKTNTYRWSSSPAPGSDDEKMEFRDKVGPVVGFRCAADKP
jgi:eukaryotic-like serine/threonine-protein kinase